jgi:hypothetical protein
VEERRLSAAFNAIKTKEALASMSHAPALKGVKRGVSTRP